MVAMRSPVRTAAHGAVLVAVAALCFVTVASGSFDVVSLPGAAPAAVPPAAAGGADDVGPVGGAGTDAAPDVDADADGGAAAEEGAPPEGSDGGEQTAGDAPSTTTDPACRDAEVAWGDAAKAQVNLSVEHPATLVAGFTSARDTLAAAEPPSAIAQDWNVVTTYLTMIADAVEAAGADDPGELARSIDRVGRRIDTSALTRSSQRVTEFFQAGCTAA